MQDKEQDTNRIDPATDGEPIPAAQEVVPAPAKPQLEAGHTPTAIVPRSMEEAFRIAQAVCVAGMAPKGLDSPAKALVAIMQGLEVGMTPMQSMQRIAVIGNRPTIWGDAAIGLVLASGKVQQFREKIIGKGDNRRAVCTIQRRGLEVVTSTFSVEQAKEAGLWGKPGPWKQYPERMLTMRARGYALRDNFADVLGGMYLREELEGEPIDITPEAVEPPQIKLSDEAASIGEAEEVEVLVEGEGAPQ